MMSRHDWEEKYCESVAELRGQEREGNLYDQDDEDGDDGPEIRRTQVENTHIARTTQRVWNGQRYITINPGDTYRRIRVREYEVGGAWLDAWTVKKLVARAETVA